MKAASVQELKDELQQLPTKQLVELCLRLSRFKKENKELLTYLLFEAHDLPGYITLVKQQMDEAFEALNTSQIFLAKKTIRKTLRIANKHVRFTGSKQSEVELLIHFCTLLKGSGIQLQKSTAMLNLYNQQLKKVRKALESMHEEEQYDYVRVVEKLER
jgi:gas vesicle protein